MGKYVHQIIRHALAFSHHFTSQIQSILEVRQNGSKEVYPVYTPEAEV